MSTTMYNNNKISASPLEQKVYFSFYEKQIFRTPEIYKIIPNKKTARQILSRLKNKGFIIQIRRSIFAIVPAQLIGKVPSVDKILIASKLTQPYFLSHHTALEIHGVAQSYHNIVYISTGKILKSFDFQNISYRFINTRYVFGTENILRGTLKIKISDRERTILDCIRNINNTGSIEEFIKSISAFPAIDYKKLSKYLALFNEKSLYHRTGYIFNILKDELNVPSVFMEDIKKKLSKRTYYLLSKRNGVYIKEWNIIAPKNIEEMMKIA